MDAILYVARTDVQWRYLPHDFPHWNTVYGYFAKWADEGVFTQLNGLLRQLPREKQGREGEPSACVIDAQSVKTSTSARPPVRASTRARRSLAGSGASSPTPSAFSSPCWSPRRACRTPSQAPGARLLDQVTADHPGIRKVWVDGGYHQHLVEHAATLGIDMEITARKPGARGFTPIPKQWAVERTYGWLILHRRLARDCETLPSRSEAVIHIAMTDLMARRLTGENTISWRDPTKAVKQPITG
ncbi:IS5 family transposase [Streptomyces sp. CoH17]|uniref:IS5 family transposase n=1 Tax=Streptomyces sp. CoH17 TaxID=2992806 RepID=UPI00226DF14F|nr:IS5 family transposase [Streptomyces sp. CoH17]